MTEQFANFAQSSLSAPITAIQTTISVASKSTFPTLGTFRIVVQSFDATTQVPTSSPEIMIVTAVAGTNFTVQRGAESSAARAFASGALVTHIVTAGVMQALQAGSGGTVTTDSTLTGNGAPATPLGINLSHTNTFIAPQYISKDGSTGSMAFPVESVVAESSTTAALGIYTNGSTVSSSHIAELFMGEAKTQGFNGFPQVQIETFTDNAGSTGSQFFKMNFVGRDNAGAIIANTPFMTVSMGNVTGLQPVVFPGGIVISDFDLASGVLSLTDGLPLIITPQQQFFGNNADITIGSSIGGLQITNSNVWITAAAYQGGGFPNTAGNTYIGVAQSSSNTPAGDADGAPGNTIFGGAVDFGQTGNIGWSGVANAQVDASGNAFFESLDLNTEMTIGSIQISSGSIFMPAGIISTDTGTGLKIGSSASELLGFYGVTPIVQPANTVALDTAFTNLGLRASGGISNFATRITSNGLPVISVLSSTGSINAKTIAATNLYTVPAGRTAIITGATIRCTAASAITVGPALGIGVAAGEQDIFASTAINALTTTLVIFGFTAVGMSVSAAAGAVIKVGIDTGSTGTSQTIAVDLMGYLL